METILDPPAPRTVQPTMPAGLNPARAVGLSLIVNAVLCALLMYPWKTDGYDQMFYYAQARSLVYDGDLYILNDLRAELPPDAAAGYDKKADSYTPRRLPIPYSIGQPALTLPFHFGARGAHDLGLLSGRLHQQLSRAIPGITALFMAVATLAVLAWAGLRLGGRAGMVLNTALYVASPMPYYFFCDASTAHGPAFFWSTMLLALLMGRPSSPAADGALLGTAAGWLVVTRWQTFPILLGVAGYRLWAQRSDRRSAAHFLTAMALCTVPLLLAQYILVQVNNPGGSGAPPQLATTAPRPAEYLLAAFFGVLFSDFNGLYYTHPALLVGTVAAASRLRDIGRPEVRTIAWGASGLLAMGAGSNALILDWWSNYSFGARRFDFAIPWAVAAGALAVGLTRRKVRAGLVAGIAILALWNVLACMRFRLADTTFFEYWSPRLTALLIREGLVFEFSVPARIWPFLIVPAAMGVIGGVLMKSNATGGTRRRFFFSRGRSALALVLVLAGLSVVLLAGSFAAARRTTKAYGKEAVAAFQIKAPVPMSFSSGGDFDSAKNPFWLFYRTDDPVKDQLRRETLRARYHRMMQFKANRHPIEREWYKDGWDQLHLAPYAAAPDS